MTVANFDAAKGATSIPGYAEVDVQRDELGQGPGPRSGDGVLTMFDVVGQRQQFQGRPLERDHAANSKPWVTLGNWQGPCAVIPLREQPGFLAAGEEPF